MMSLLDQLFLIFKVVVKNRWQFILENIDFEKVNENMNFGYVKEHESPCKLVVIFKFIQLKFLHG